jgi:hypothetical protein
VPSWEWLEFEGGVISSLFAQTESALSRRWRSRHENGYHKAAGGCSELWWIFGDGVNQAADLASGATSIPSRNLTPLMTFGN